MAIMNRRQVNQTLLGSVVSLGIPRLALAVATSDKIRDERLDNSLAFLRRCFEARKQVSDIGDLLSPTAAGADALGIQFGSDGAQRRVIAPEIAIEANQRSAPTNDRA